MSRYIFTCLIWIACLLPSHGQNVPIGTWQTHLPYANAVSVAHSKNYLYGASESAVFSYSLADGSIKKFTKAEGLSDVGVSAIAYDTTTSSLVIAYTNSNIDILRDGKVMNLPYIMNANILGSKQITRIFAYRGVAYLATGFGVVRLNLEKQEIGDSYFFNDGASNFKVHDVWANDEYIYAASVNGLYQGRNDGTVNLVNLQNWKKFGPAEGIATGSSTAVAGREKDVFAAVGSVIYRYEDDLWMPYYNMPANEINGMYKSPNRLIACQNDRIAFIPDNGSPTIASGVYYIARPLQILETDNGEVYYADLYRCVVRYDSPSSQSPILPNGPARPNSKGIDFLDQTVYIGSSPISAGWYPTFNADGFYFAKDYFWSTRNGNNLEDIKGAYDIAVVKALPSEGLVFMGANNTGMVEYNPATNRAKFITNLPGATSNMRITAAHRDIYDNLWITNAYSNQPLICRKPGGEYITFSSSLINNKLVHGITVDDFNQVWMTIADGGVVVFSYGNSLDDKSDDQFITFTTTPGAGGLPTNSVTSIATDLDGQVWIGSTQGVVYVPCPGSVFNRECDAQQICVPRNDGTNFCDILLETENVNTILVDPANRKWFGTSNGLFLQSEDGYKNIHYFSESNSPLLSNRIRSLGINPENGELFICTESGIISYRADATETGSNSGKPYAYPNPVRPDYKGTIAVRNLPNNSNVKIVDISGKLVMETTASGGQLVWDGNDRSGNRVTSGIYYILATSADKKDKVVTKLAFIR